MAYGMGLDPRIGPSFLKAGIGFGGFCFPKDLAAFERMAERLGAPFYLLKKVLESNEEQKVYFVNKIRNALWNLSNKRIGILGLSFKPNTDDMRFAPSIEIIQALQKEGAIVQAYDPEAMAKSKTLFKKVIFKRNPYEVAKKADALAILTEWDEFLQMDFKRVKKLLRNPVIFDGRNALNPKELKKLGFHYYGMGRKA